MKRLVVCCDGTWNSPDEVDGDVPVPTNVCRIAQAVAPRDGHGREQHVFYDKGVGTGGPLDRITGGAFGAGLAKNVRDAYRFLVETFEPGDEIFLFGFSRGAFTARSTAGFVRNCGILRRDHVEHLDDAWALYHSGDPSTHPRSTEAELFRRSFSVETGIRFIGVFDTVGSLGVPIADVPGAALINRHVQFHDTELSGRVDGAFHALAMHERRGTFSPTLWTVPRDQPRTSSQDLEQVWFSGVHSDVGGGYARRGLADITLLWMLSRAERYGLTVAPGSFPRHRSDPMRREAVWPDALAHPHDSLATFPYRFLPRFRRTPVAGTTVSSSAVDHEKDRSDAPDEFAGILGDVERTVPVEHSLGASGDLVDSH
jgi:uncharacterized protein (DUF2235 family)